MLCNKSDCDCYSNTNNPHYAMIPTCNICQFVYYNTRLQKYINNTFHCSNKHCNKTYFKNDTSTLILLVDDDFDVRRKFIYLLSLSLLPLFYASFSSFFSVFIHF